MPSYMMSHLQRGCGWGSRRGHAQAGNEKVAFLFSVTSESHGILVYGRQAKHAVYASLLAVAGPAASARRCPMAATRVPCRPPSRRLVAKPSPRRQPRAHEAGERYRCRGGGRRVLGAVGGGVGGGKARWMARPEASCMGVHPRIYCKKVSLLAYEVAPR